MRKPVAPSLRFEARAYDRIGPLWVGSVEVTRKSVKVSIDRNTQKHYYWQPKGDLSAIEACRFIGRQLRCEVRPYV